MNYFNNIRFISASVIPECHSVINSEFRDTFNLQFVYSGKMYLGINHGNRTMIDQPILFWHLPGISYQYGPADQNGWYHNWFTFRGKRAEEIMCKGFSQLSDSGFVYIQNPEDIREVFQKIIHYINDDYPKYHAEATVLLEKLLCMLTAERQNDKISARYIQDLNVLINEIRINPGPNYDFKSIARKIGLSYSHFRQIFREHSGRSPQDFLLYCRMKAASEKLQDLNVSIQETAFEFGYNDQAQFSKMFKNKIGLSPKQFRNSLPIGKHKYQ